MIYLGKEKEFNNNNYKILVLEPMMGIIKYLRKILLEMFIFDFQLSVDQLIYYNLDIILIL